ncbi:MAG: hypothetical protein PHW04_02415 [Candidatus Wallbacteria bacterium]|nr:hypothetical protein [Candidatus Wallbacteria bacterium]
MSRITKALRKAETESIPLRRKSCFNQILDQLLPQLPRPFSLSILYQEQDTAYRRFIGHFTRAFSERFEVRLITKDAAAFSEFEINCQEGRTEEHLIYIFDNIDDERSRLVFLVNRADFFVYHNFPAEKILGAILIR